MRAGRRSGRCALLCTASTRDAGRACELPPRIPPTPGSPSAAAIVPAPGSPSGSPRTVSCPARDGPRRESWRPNRCAFEASRGSVTGCHRARESRTRRPDPGITGGSAARVERRPTGVGRAPLPSPVRPRCRHVLSFAGVCHDLWQRAHRSGCGSAPVRCSGRGAIALSRCARLACRRASPPADETCAPTGSGPAPARMAGHGPTTGVRSIGALPDMARHGDPVWLPGRRRGLRPDRPRSRPLPGDGCGHSGASEDMIAGSNASR